MWRIVAGHPKTFYTGEEVVRFTILPGPIAWLLLDFGALSSFSLYYVHNIKTKWRILYTGPPLLSPTSPLETHRLRARQLRDGSSHNVASEMLPAKTVPPLEHFLSQEVGKVARNIIYLFVHYHSNVCLYVSSNVSVSESVQVVH